MERERLGTVRRPAIQAKFRTFQEKAGGRKPAPRARDHPCCQQRRASSNLALQLVLQPAGKPVDPVPSGDAGGIGKLGIGDQPVSGRGRR